MSITVSKIIGVLGCAASAWSTLASSHTDDSKVFTVISLLIAWLMTSPFDKETKVVVSEVAKASTYLKSAEPIIVAVDPKLDGTINNVTSDVAKIAAKV